MKTVLLTGIGGITPQNIARSLKLVNPAYRVIGTDIDKLTLGIYHDSVDKSYIVPRASDVMYYYKINEIIKKEKVDLLICSPDSELRYVSQNRNKINCKMFLPSDEVINVALNKARTFDICQRYQLPVPKTVLIKDNSDLERAFDTIGETLWLRASEGTSGLGSLKVSDFDLAKLWLEVNNGWGSFTASEFLPGRNLACKLLYNNGKLIAAHTAERLKYLMSQVAPSGITGNVSLGSLIYNETVQEISIKAVESIFENYNEKPHGMFTVDLKENSNKVPCITEINPRHIATTYAFTLGGTNFSDWMVKIALGREVVNLPEKDIYMKKPKYFMRHVDSLPILVDKPENT